MIPAWVDAYVGLEYADRGRERPAVDCYGLVRLVYLERLGIELDDHAGGYSSATDPHVPRLIELGAALAGWEKTAALAMYDVLVFNVDGHPTHCALYLADGRMLHVTRHTSAVVEPVKAPRWRNRFAYALRHPAFPAS